MAIETCTLYTALAHLGIEERFVKLLYDVTRLRTFKEVGFNQILFNRFILWLHYLDMILFFGAAV